ncbi:MAG: aldolase/citrate lyase family protein [Thermoleophilia bacterium]
MAREFQLILFSVDPGMISEAGAAGIDGFIVDWENRGKQRRQALVDTQINCNTIEDLVRVRRATTATVICRINQFGDHTTAEVEAAIDAGVDEILLPMARHPEEVESVIDMAWGRAGVGMLVETVAAVELAAEFSRLPLSRVYIGLNDLAIDRGTPNIFTAVVDGTVNHVREQFTVPFGLAGLTLPDRGHPVPCRLLIAELARLASDFTFLRRSFLSDIRGRQMAVEVPRLRQAIVQARRRNRSAIERDHRELRQAIAAWRPAAAAVMPVD